MKKIKQIPRCGVSRDAEQLFFILVIDYTAIRLITIFIYWFQYGFYYCCHPYLDKKKSDKGRPDFDLAEEYLELLYRQFIIYLAIPLFPLVSLLALIGGLFEYPIDKMVLLKISKTPPFLSGSMKSYLVFYMFFIAVFATFIFPQGIFWVLIGFPYNPNNCANTIFDVSGLFGTTNSTR